VNNLNLDNVLLKGWLNRIEVKVLLSESKIGLVTLHPVPNYYDAYPVKMFEYMAAGLPVIASDFPVYREIIEKADCGLVVDPLDVEVTKKKIITLLDSPEILTKFSQNGREAALKYYNWNNEFQSLLNLYQKVLGKPLI
jgi:glycosyltransferase involved in cell wall biosynthesis